MQLLDISFFRPWRANLEKRLSIRLRRHRVGVHSIIELAMESYKAMFQNEDDGGTKQHQGIIRAFADVGIMPYNPHALPDSAFKPAEMAGKARHDACVRLGVVDVPDEDLEAVIHAALPFVPAIPIDEEKIKKAEDIVRKSRATVPVLLTALEIRDAATSKSLQHEAERVRLLAVRERRAVNKLSRDAATAAKASARAASNAVKSASGASAAPRQGRPSKSALAPQVERATSVPSVADPSAGLKRSAASAAIGGADGGADERIMLRIKRSRPHEEGDD